MWRAVGTARDHDLARLLDLIEAILSGANVADEPRMAGRRVFKALNRLRVLLRR